MTKQQEKDRRKARRAKYQRTHDTADIVVIARMAAGRACGYLPAERVRMMSPGDFR